MLKKKWCFSGSKPWKILAYLSLHIILSSSTVSSQIRVPENCPEKCGNITVPYPFGIGDNCHYGTPFDDGLYFNLTCNTRNNPPTLALGNNITLEKITLDGELWANYPISYRCYQSNSSLISSEYKAFIRTKRFPLSTTKNLIGAIGCDTYVLLNATINNNREFRAGCLTICASPEDVDKSNCSGNGCCLVSIPNGVTNLDFTFRSLDDQKLVQDFNPCSVAFVLAKDHAGKDNVLPFSITEMLSQNERIYRENLKFPVVFNWAIGNVSCEKARENGKYICKGNSICVETPYQEGYGCQCKPGFNGNPYLHDCQDINECDPASNSPCSMVCVNTPGNYTCKCPSGYVGDGFKNGTGCTKIAFTNSSSLKKLTLGLSISLGSILLLLCGFWIYALFKKRVIVKQKAMYFQRNGGLLLQEQISCNENILARMKIFTADDLDRATDHFNKDRILGKGGQGTVYKGMLSEGKIVAIKISKIQADESRLSEFINEVVILSQINHRNIVKLLGCCLETEVPILVYEFIPNGTLSHHIQHPSEEFPITWRMRLQIASDSAAALAYLHSSSATPVLHRDIKTSNILLDEKYRAKLSDFGMSRSIDLDQTHITTRVVGTYGYLDPEYFQSSQFTDKSDVYSFGVVLVELLTGQKAVRTGATSVEDKNLTFWFLDYMENSRLLDIIDTQLVKEGSKEEFYSIANLAKRCLKLSGRSRPSMKEVLLEIETVLSLHFPEQIGPETQQVAIDATTEVSHSYSHSRTFNSENYSSSVELSLI